MLFLVYGSSLAYAEMATVTFGWIVLLQVGVVVLQRVQDGVATSRSNERPRFLAYAVSLLERKVLVGEIKSAKGREKWGDVIEHHLTPAFGDFFIDKISRAYFWDDDPNTQGPPSACVNSTLADVPLETIVSGNINVK